MATLNVTTIARTGIDILPGGANMNAAAAGLSDQFPNTGAQFVVIDNAGGVTCNVTLAIAQTVDGRPVTGPTVAVAAGGRKIIGPFPPLAYSDPTTGRMTINYDQVASVKVGVFAPP